MRSSLRHAAVARFSKLAQRSDYLLTSKWLATGGRSLGGDASETAPAARNERCGVTRTFGVAQEMVGAYPQIRPSLYLDAHGRGDAVVRRAGKDVFAAPERERGCAPDDSPTARPSANHQSYASPARPFGRRPSGFPCPAQDTASFSGFILASVPVASDIPTKAAITASVHSITFSVRVPHMNRTRSRAAIRPTSACPSSVCGPPR